MSRFNKIVGYRLGVGLFTLVLLLGGVYLVYPSLRARYLFHELGALQVGHSSFEDAQRLAKRLGATPITLTPCNQSYCYWSSEYVSNARLPKWWRGSGVTFAIDFEVKDSVVRYKGAWYGIGILNIDSNYVPVSSVSVGVQEKWIFTRAPNRVIVEPPTSKGWGINYLERNGNREIASTKFQVNMTPRSSVEDWQRYTAFNYSCFWKYKGCKDAKDLLPTADPFPDDK
jgi:uncharacterized protein (UPF0548 family)